MNSPVLMRLILVLFSLMLVGLAFVSSPEAGTTSIVGWGLGYAFCYTVFSSAYEEEQQRTKQLSEKLSELEGRLRT